MAELLPAALVDIASPAPVAVAQRRLVTLTRTERPREQALTAVRRLLQLVVEWGPEVALEITCGAGERAGNVLTFALSGPVPSSWEDDLSWALGPVGTLAAERGRATPPPPHLWELLARRRAEPRATLLPAADTEQRDPASTEIGRMAALRAADPWPLAMHADLAELLALNVGARPDGLVLRYRLAGTSRLEVDMLRQELDASYEPLRVGLHDYLGHAVRLRALVGGSLPVAARARALISEWGSGLRLVPVAPPDIPAAWTGGAVSLAGHAVPHGTALALLRVPAAGSAVFPGIPTAVAPIPARALDPLPPRPRRPVHLGIARTADQRRTSVAVDLEDLLQHCFVQGASGSGKSTLLTTLATGILDAGGSVTLLDPEGSTVSSLLTQVRAEHASSIRVVRHGTADLDTPLNLLAGPASARERMVGMFAEMIQRSQDPQGEGMVGPRWKRWFTLLSLAAAELLGHDATLVSVSSIATEMSRVRELAAAVRPLNADLAHRLLAEYGRLEGKEATDLISWAISKLNEIISSESARWIFGAGADGVDVGAAMENGESLLVDLGAHRLGEPTARAIAATYLLKHWAALGGCRAERPHVVLVDEAHLFSYGALPKLLAEARKFHVGVVVATQHLGQLTGELADALESNTGCFVSLRAGLHGAARAAVRLDGWPASELVRLPDLTAAATLSRRGVVTTPFTLELDQHARVRRWTRAGLVGPAVAEAIVEASARTADGYRSLRPLTDEELTARIRGLPSPDPREGGDLDAWFSRPQSAAGRT